MWCFSSTAIIFGFMNQWVGLGVACLPIKPNDPLVLPSWGFADLEFLVLKDFLHLISNYGFTDLKTKTST